MVFVDWLEEEDATDVDEDDRERRLDRRGADNLMRGAAMGMTIPDLFRPERENLGTLSISSQSVGGGCGDAELG